MAKTIIDRAIELKESHGVAVAINHFEEEIKKLSPSKSFEDTCSIAANKTAIAYLQNRI